MASKLVKWMLAAIALAVAPSGFDPDARADESATNFQDYKPYACGWGKVCALGAIYDAAGAVVKDQVYAISYGTTATTYQMLVSGRTANHVCEPRLGADFPPNSFSATPFRCQVQPILLPEDLGGFVRCSVSAPDYTCRAYAGEDRFFVARFGTDFDNADPADDTWIYQFVGGTFPCTRDNFDGMSAATVDGGGKGRCERSKNHVGTAIGGQWVTCATDGAACRFPTAGSYLVRYSGVNDEYLGPDQYSRSRIVSGEEIKCTAAAFNSPAGKLRNAWCQYLELPKIARVFGEWEIVGTCENCTNVTYDLTTGVVQGQTNTLETSWSAELSQKVEQKGYFGLSNVSGEVRASQTLSGRNMISDSFTTSGDATLTVTCDLGAVWQWVTSVQNYCLPNSGATSSCVAVARSKMFQCLRPGEAPGEQPLALRSDGTTPTGQITTSPACLAKWQEIAGGELIIPSARAAKALNVDEYVVDPDGNYQITYRNWTFLCDSILGGAQ